MARFTLRDGAGGLPPPHDTHAYQANGALNDTQQASVFTERAAARGYDHKRSQLVAEQAHDPGRRTQCSPVNTGL
jgi:hypothetical protein